MKCKDWKIGFSSKFYMDKLPLEERHGKKAMSLMKAAGITCMELACTYEEMEEIGFISDPEKIKTEAAEIGIELWSVHLPYNALENGRHVERYVRNNKVIESAAKAGFKVINIHPSHGGIKSTRREEKLADSIVNIKIIAEYCLSLGLIPAIEDVPRAGIGHNTDEIMRILEACPEVKVTFDTNHLLTENNDDNLSFVKAVGSKIVSTHISDYDISTERHWVPLDGDIDWAALVRALEDAGYCGPFLYETLWYKRRVEGDPEVTPEMLKEIHTKIAAMAEADI